RALLDDRGRPVKEVGPSLPVEVLGLQALPRAGDLFQVVSDEVKARQIGEYRQSKLREAALARSASARVTLEQLAEQLKTGEAEELPLVIQGDVQGYAGVLSDALPKLSNDQVKLKILHSGVGAITETDVLLASASNATIIGFNVRPERKAMELARQEKGDIAHHTIIDEVMDKMKKAMTGLLEPVIREVYLERSEVRETFRIPKVGMVAGCYV